MPPKILPVIHLLDHATALEQVTLARDCGSDGVFLISHKGNDEELVEIAWASKRLHPDFPIGVNLLSKSPMAAALQAWSVGMNMVWADDMGASSKGLTVEGRDLAALKAQFPSYAMFASVAFKYQPHEPDPQAAAVCALQAGFIPTTSGTATGSAPQLEKIVAMSAATNGLLAVASGITPENIASFAPYLSHVLVATGIGLDEYRIDPVKLRLLITNAAAATTIQEPLGSPMPDHNTLNSQQSAADNLVMWTIFDHPRDYPAGFIARKFIVSNGKVHPTEEALQGETLESVQQQLPPGLFCLGRSPGDDSKIVESWF